MGRLQQLSFWLGVVHIEGLVTCKVTDASLKDHKCIDLPGGSPPTPLKDEELVARAQNGERWASEELVIRYQQKAYGIAYHLCGENSEDAQELTQEAFLRALRGLANFKGKSTFYTWFYRILINVCLDKRRCQRRWQRIFLPWWPSHREKESPRQAPEEQADTRESTNPIKAANNKQLKRDIRKSLMSLPERQRVAFELKVLHGMSIREIARVMGAAEGTVKSHIFRATRFLREELNEWAQP